MKHHHFTPNLLLIQARLNLGLSQSALALRLGVSLKALWRWENGIARPYPRRRFLLCAFFHKTAEELGLDPVNRAFPQSTLRDIPEETLLQVFLENQKNNPVYLHEYQAYVQRSQQFHHLHQCAVSFVDWFLVAHPEQAREFGNTNDNSFNKPA
jgi:transcriptional regulator with XRE-family HTH domain